MHFDLFDHWGDALTGAFSALAALHALSYMVQTFPVPKNPYAQWLLGVARFIIAQKEMKNGVNNTGIAKPPDPVVEKTSDQ